MKLAYARSIDKSAGVLCCGLLSVAAGLARILMRVRHASVAEKPVAKVLVIKFLGFGSIILAARAFKALRDCFPNAYLCAVTLKQNAAVYEMMGVFDEIISIDGSSIIAFLSGAFRELSRIRSLSFDAAIDFEFTSRFTALLTFFSRAPIRLGFAYRNVWRGDCYTETVEFREDELLTQSYQKLVSSITGGQPFTLEPLTLHLPEDDRRFVDSVFKDRGLPAERWLIAVNINASPLCMLRRWPQEYFQSLVEELIRRYPVEIIFIGDKHERGYVFETVRRIVTKGHVHDFSGLFTLKQLAYVLGKADLFISNDSGPLHLAAFQGTPTVSFFGPETPLIYGPQGDAHIVLYTHLYCSPCIRVKNYKVSKCSNNVRCLREITPNDVLAAIERKHLFLQSKTRGEDGCIREKTF
jgi:ADP-heptose:LPS heptosyltransferase